MAIYYNGNAKILFYIGGKKLIKKGMNMFTHAFYICYFAILL